MLDLDRSTVTKIMQVILDRGLVVTTGKNTEQSGVGRRQINLEINQDIGVVLGLEVQDVRYTAVLVTLDGKVLHSFDGVAPVSKDNLVAHIVSLTRRAETFARERGLFLLGIGIGIPGIVDPYTGVVIKSHSFRCLARYDLHAELARELSVPVIIENDANCCCWAELAFRRETRSRNFIAVLAEFRDTVDGDRVNAWHGLAIGMGMVIRGRVLHGDHFTTGEFRSVFATRRDGQFKSPHGESLRYPEHAEDLRALYRELADNLALLVNCVDLTKVVFAGDFTQDREYLQSCVKQSCAENWNFDIPRDIEVEFSDSGKLSVSIGAAGLFVEKLFSVPDIADRFQELVGYDLYSRILDSKGK